MLDDHCTILGIHRNATPEEIHDAYLAVAKTCHPDTNPDDPEGTSLTSSVPTFLSAA